METNDDHASTVESITHLEKIEDPTEFEEERHVIFGEIEINFLGDFDGHMLVRFEVIVVTVLGHKSLDVTITVDLDQVDIGNEGAEERQNNPTDDKQFRYVVPLKLDEVDIGNKSAQEGQRYTTDKREDRHDGPTGVGREGLVMVRHSVELVRRLVELS